MPPKEVTDDSQPKSFAEKKHLIQNSLNFGRFQKKPPVANKEKSDTEASKAPKVTPEVMASPLPKPKPSALEGGKGSKKGLHASLMAEMMSKLGNGSSEDVCSEMPKNNFSKQVACVQQQHSCQPWPSSRENKGSKAFGRDQASSKQSEELKRENDNLSSELQHMKEKLNKQEEEMDSKVSKLV